MSPHIAVLSTAGSIDSAQRIARHLVDRRLAACVNILPGVISIYRWKGAIQESAEWMLIMKTRRECFPALRDELKAVHEYEVPEIVALDITDGLPDYLDWIGQESGLNS
jgi:periplasmic divalent cation tolerance protein